MMGIQGTQADKTDNVYRFLRVLYNKKMLIGRRFSKAQMDIFVMIQRSPETFCLYVLRFKSYSQKCKVAYYGRTMTQI